MENKEYWIMRAEQNFLHGEKMALDMTKQLDKVYKNATKRINKELESFYGRYATDNKITLEESKKRLTPNERKSFIDMLKDYKEESKKYGYSKEFNEHISRLSKMVYITRLEELNTNILLEIERLYADELERFKTMLDETYEYSFENTMYNTMYGVGMGINFTKPNVRAVEIAVNTKWLGENYSDRIWKDKQRLILALQETIPRGFVLGYNPKKVGSEISKITNTRYNAAVRLARTEMNHISNQAAFDSYKETGLVEQYEYLATLDSRTSQICRDLDGKVFNMKYKQVGVNYPPAHVSCRSTSIPYFNDDTVTERIAKDSTGKYYTIPKMSYREWESKYKDK